MFDFLTQQARDNPALLPEEGGEKIAGGGAVHGDGDGKLRDLINGSGGSVRARLLQLEIDVAEFVERAVGADFGGADGAFEDAGDFGEREFLKTREEQHLADIAIEAGEGGAEECVIVARRRMVRGVGCVVGVFLEVRGVGGVRRGVALAEMIRGAAAGEVIHPGGEAAVVAIGVPVFQHALKHGLHDILGGFALAGVFH